MKKKHSTLLFAAAHGHREIVQALIDAGADVNHQNNDGHTALIRASYWGYLEIVQTLIDAGADVNHQNQFGDTALMQAAERGHLEIVQTLIDAGADVKWYFLCCKIGLSVEIASQGLPPMGNSLYIFSRLASFRCLEKKSTIN